MAKWFRFRVLSLLILVSVIGVALATYLAFYRPGNVSIRLSSGELLINHEDIQSVDWDAQRYNLRPGLKAELSKRFHAEGGLIGGIPFEFCIDNDTLFTGRLTTSLSSFGFSEIAINLLPISQNDAVVDLEWGYPASPAPDRNVDPRFSHRLYTSLWLDGKLNLKKGK